MTVKKRRTKFINEQRHRASCGPIAVANLIKWHGIETSYLKVLNFCVGMRAFSYTAGMWPYQMSYVLKTLKIPFKVKRKFRIGDLDSILDAGGSVILVYQTRNGGHAVFISGRTADGFVSWNRRKGEPPWFPRDEMAKALRVSARTRDGLYAYVFQPVKDDKN